MTDNASMYEAPPTVVQSRPALHVLAAATDHAPVSAADDDEASIWRTAAIGSAVGFTVVTTSITAAGTIGGMGTASALGLGTFVGMWSGAGFGFMLGALIRLAQQHSTDAS